MNMITPHVTLCGDFSRLLINKGTTVLGAMGRTYTHSEKQRIFSSDYH